MLIIAVLIASLLGSVTTSTCEKEDRKLLVVSLDGLCGDYLQSFHCLLPNLNKIALNVRAEYVIPSFPTVSVSNHWSIVTGVHPESHGMVLNEFYDPASDTFFVRREVSFFTEYFWNTFEPIYITAEKQGIRTQHFMWYGIPFMDNVYCSRIFPAYNESVTFEQRVDWIMEGFLQENIKMGFMYFHEPDNVGHYYGPFSNEALVTLSMIDKGIGYLLEQLKKTGLERCLDLVIITDHGMTEVYPDQVIVIDELLKEHPLEYYLDYSKHGDSPFSEMAYNSVIHVWPYEDKTDLLYNHLISSRNSQYSDRPFEVYKKEEIPLKFNYRNNARIAPIVLLAKPGWQIALNRVVFQHSPMYLYKGIHGYDFDVPEMRGSFIAMGPSFYSNIVLPPVQLVDLYSLMAHLVEIVPNANNGTINSFLQALKSN